MAATAPAPARRSGHRWRFHLPSGSAPANVGNGYTLPSSGEATVQTFVNPLPITSVTVRCDALNAGACRIVFAVATI